MSSAHPLVLAAAEGVFPPWTVAGEARRAHALRVRELLVAWAEARGIGASERIRWAAAGTLHDALREADPEDLRRTLQEAEGAGGGADGGSTFFAFDGPAGATPVSSLPDPLLHGPAAALRLHRDGVRDPGLLRAVAWHTIGHPAFDGVGEALACADFLEPGRPDPEGWRERLRTRYPGDPGGVLAKVTARRLEGALARRRPLLPLTVALWNDRVGHPMPGVTSPSGGEG